MTIERALFSENLHPRGTGAAGGQFVAKGSGPAKAPPARGGRTPAAGRKPKPAGNLAFDGRRGPGYGQKHGDKRVKNLQTALNRLGLTDSSGKKLSVDGKLGPKTTAAIKKAQRALGLKADGVVTPALLAKLTKAKSLKKPAKVAHAAPARKTAHAAPARKTAHAAPARGRAVAPRRAGRGGSYRAADRTVQVSRSVSYSERMTDLERHGTHNQQSHGNRLGRPSNVPGKTGLAKLAEQDRVGTSNIRLDDEVTVSKGPAGYSRSPHLGKTGTVVDSNGSHHIVEFDDGSGQHQIHQSELKVKRTRHDAALERERRAKLDVEVKAIRDRADARRKAPAMDITHADDVAGKASVSYSDGMTQDANLTPTQAKTMGAVPANGEIEEGAARQSGANLTALRTLERKGLLTKRQGTFRPKSGPYAGQELPTWYYSVKKGRT